MKKEQPDKILNKNIILKGIEAAPNGLISGLVIEGVIKTFDNDNYRVEFIVPAKLNGKTEKTARISARHENCPISDANKNAILAVAGEFGSGADFLACINLK